MSDRIDAMRLFLAVAETGSFSKAAEAEGLGQPTVSRRVAELEARLGARLLHRTTRAVSLTEAGRRFQERAAALVAAYEEAEAEARGLERTLVGLVRVQSAITFGRTFLAASTARFLCANPHVRLDLSLDNAFIDPAAEGVDLVMRVGPVRDAALGAKLIGRWPQIIFASPDFVARAAPFSRPEDLCAAPFALFPRAGPASLTLTGPNGPHTISVDARVRSNAPEVVRAAALEGLVAGAGPALMVEPDIEAGRLVRLLPDMVPPPAPIHAVWSPGRRLGAKARALLAHVEAELAAAGYGPDGPAASA